MQADQLFELIGIAIGVDKEKLTMESKSSDFPEWDSLGHINVLMALQEHYGDSYQEDPALASAVSIKEIFDVLQR